MEDYYTTSLNSNSLRKCYEVAPKRIQQYLDAELQYAFDIINKNDAVLDLGCGYGRVTEKVASKAGKVIGIDLSEDNIRLAKEFTNKIENCEFHVMNAIDLKFENNIFDLVFCIQNGISAFKVSPIDLVNEAIRVTKKGGRLLFSTYSEKFWNERMKWFIIQSEQGLIGEIDFDETKNGTIICKDGFKATTYSKKDFVNLAETFNLNAQITEVDNSSLFCEIIIR